MGKVVRLVVPPKPNAVGSLKGVSVYYIIHQAEYRKEPDVLRKVLQLVNKGRDINILASEDEEHRLELLLIHTELKRFELVPWLVCGLLWARRWNLAFGCNVYTSSTYMNGVYAIQLGVRIL